MLCLLPARSPPRCGDHCDLRRRRRCCCRNPRGNTCNGHCLLQPRSLPDPQLVSFRPAPAVPGQGTMVNLSPARSNRQGDQFNQFTTTATHTAVPGTWSCAQKPWARLLHHILAPLQLKTEEQVSKMTIQTSITQDLRPPSHPRVPGRQPPTPPSYISNTTALHCKSCLAQVRSSTGSWIMGGKPSFHSRWTSLKMLLLTYRQSQSKSRLCLAQAGPQLGYSSLWGLRRISWG